MRQIILSALVASGLLATVGCGNGIPTPGTDAGTDAGTDGGVAHTCGTDVTEVSAEALYTQVIDTQCKSCHFTGAPETTGGNLVLDSVEALKATAGTALGKYGTVEVTDPDHPENSTMYLKVLGGEQAGVKGPNGQSVGQRMPLGQQLPEAQVALIKNWICSGAD